MKTGKKNIAIAAAFFMANIFIKAYAIAKNDIALDEPFSIFHAQMGIGQIITELVKGNNPPLFEILLHYWIKLVGIAPTAVRLLPVIFSSCTAIVVFVIGNKFYSRFVGIVGALIFSFSNFQIDIGHQVRAYSLFLLLSSLSLYLFLSLFKEPEKKKYFLFLTIINIILIYTHYFGFFVLLIEGIAVLLFTEYSSRVFKGIILANIVTIILYLPLIKVISKRFFASSNGTWLAQPSLASPYEFLWKMSNAPVSVVITLAILLLSFSIWLFKDKRYPINITTRVLLLWFFFPILFSFIISYRLPVFLDRYMVYVSVSYYLLIAIALDKLRVFKYSSFIATGIILLVMVISFKSNYGDKRNWVKLVNRIAKEKTNNTLVVIYPEWLDLAFAYHYDLMMFKDYTNLRKDLLQQKIYPVVYFNQLDSMQINNADKILFINESLNVASEDSFQNCFRKRFIKSEKYNVELGPEMYLYSNKN